MSPSQTMCFLMRCALAPIPENVTGTCRLLFLVSGVLPLTENMKIFGNTTVFSLFLFPQTGGGYGRCDAATAMRRQRQSRRGTGAPRALARAHVPCPRDVRLGSRLGPGPALDSRRVSVSRLLEGGRVRRRLSVGEDCDRAALPRPRQAGPLTRSLSACLAPSQLGDPPASADRRQRR